MNKIMKYENAYKKLRDLEAIGILHRWEVDTKIKELGKTAEEEGEDFYADRFLIGSEDIPSDLNYEERAEWIMDAQFMGYHF